MRPNASFNAHRAPEMHNRGGNLPYSLPAQTKHRAAWRLELLTRVRKDQSTSISIALRSDVFRRRLYLNIAVREFGTHARALS